MPDWLSEHIGEIALLIYIVYPLIKRWWDRQKERRGQKQTKPQTKPQTQTEARAQEKAPRQRHAETRPKEADFLEAARKRIGRLKQETARLLLMAQTDPRLARLVPALRDDLLGRIENIERSLRGSPTISTIVQDTAMIQGLEELLRYLAAMVQQRTRGRSSFLADADALADSCYAPLLEFARVQGLRLRTSQPVSVAGDWSLSIVPRFASTRVAPLRLPAGFESSLWHWPAIAHEVAHDFYFSLESLQGDLRDRLALPQRVDVPTSEMELDAGWLRRLYGAWLPEVFRRRRRDPHAWPCIRLDDATRFPQSGIATTDGGNLPRRGRCRRAPTRASAGLHGDSCASSSRATRCGRRAVGALAERSPGRALLLLAARR